MAIAFDLVTERTDHLAVAVVTAFADIDVAPGQLERGVGAHTLDFLDRVVDPEQRRDLDDAADRHRDEGKGGEQRDVALEFLVAFGKITHRYGPYSAGARAGSAARAGSG